jgi:hypothetical protein
MKKHTSVVTTVTPELPGIPRASGFNGFLRALLGDRACLPPSPARSSPYKLDINVGMSGPHDFAVRKARLRQRHACVHRIPPHVRDDRETPLERDGMIRSIAVSTKPSSKISENQK